MNFSWVAEQLRSGSKVRRAAWAESSYCVADKEEDGFQPIRNDYNTPRVFEVADFEANDWELYIEPTSFQDAVRIGFPDREIRRKAWAPNRQLICLSASADKNREVAEFDGKIVTPLKLTVGDYAALDWYVITVE